MLATTFIILSCTLVGLTRFQGIDKTHVGSHDSGLGLGVDRPRAR